MDLHQIEEHYFRELSRDELNAKTNFLALREILLQKNSRHFSYVSLRKKKMLSSFKGVSTLNLPSVLISKNIFKRASTTEMTFIL